MIQELLEATISVITDSGYEIYEFKLGTVPYEILKKEVESIIPIKVDIKAENTTYRGIPVKLHQSINSITYSIRLKSK